VVSGICFLVSDLKIIRDLRVSAVNPPPLLSRTKRRPRRADLHTADMMTSSARERRSGSGGAEEGQAFCAELGSDPSGPVRTPQGRRTAGRAMASANETASGNNGFTQTSRLPITMAIRDRALHDETEPQFGTARQNRVVPKA
jgi:hypothetical protein